MHTTRISFLQQLGDGRSDAWLELDQIYRPLIHGWLRRYQLQASDCDDITQEVMAVVARQVDDFKHNGRAGAFRNWLRTTTVNLARNYLRKHSPLRGKGSDTFTQMLNELADPESELAKEFNTEHDKHVVKRLLEQVGNDFEAETMQMFRMYVLQGETARDTAASLKVSVASVHTAKSRVLRKLREYAANWIDEVHFQ